MRQRGDPETEAALWMLAQLAARTQDKVRRRLAIRVDPPKSPLEHRERELGFAAKLLRPIPPRAGRSFAYVPRKEYDAQRPQHSPSSASLVVKYGSWANVCRHAYGLVCEQRRPRLNPLPRYSMKNRERLRYTKEEAAAALRDCARELDRAPSKRAYSYWREAAERRRGGRRGYPCANVIGRLYAERGGWTAALEDAALIAPPAMTVRVHVSTKDEAAELVAVARAKGLIAAHASNRTWIEVRGNVARVRRRIIDCARAVALPNLTIWEPQTMRLERVDLRARAERDHETQAPPGCTH